LPFREPGHAPRSGISFWLYGTAARVDQGVAQTIAPVDLLEYVTSSVSQANPLANGLLGPVQ
jgi:hypothetical protein